LNTLSVPSVSRAMVRVKYNFCPIFADKSGNGCLYRQP